MRYLLYIINYIIEIINHILGYVSERKMVCKWGTKLRHMKKYQCSLDNLSSICLVNVWADSRQSFVRTFGYYVRLYQYVNVTSKLQ